MVLQYYSVIINTNYCFISLLHRIARNRALGDYSSNVILAISMRRSMEKSIEDEPLRVVRHKEKGANTHIASQSL